MSDYFLPSKTCSLCHVDKPLSEFYNRARASDGKFSQCKTCWVRLNRERRRKGGAWHKERGMRLVKRVAERVPAYQEAQAAVAAMGDELLDMLYNPGRGVAKK
jgi:hypothetical protein